MEIYVVRGGDSLYGIARRYGTDAAELARINLLLAFPFDEFTPTPPYLTR